VSPAGAQRGGSLAAGGGIGEVRTRAKDDVTCSVSDESAPPLAPNCSLADVFLLNLLRNILLFLSPKFDYKNQYDNNDYKNP